MHLTSEEVDILFRALDSLEKEMGQGPMMAGLLEAMLGDRLSEEQQLKVRFDREEREREAQRKLSIFRRESAVLRAKLVGMETVSR